MGLANFSAAAKSKFEFKLKQMLIRWENRDGNEKCVF